MNNDDNRMMQKYLEEYRSHDLYFKYYEKDNILNYLNYWIKYYTLEDYSAEIDKFWYQEIGNQEGVGIDTIFSAWYPLKIYFQKLGITIKSGELTKKLEPLKELKDAYLEWIKTNEVDSDIREFINIASERCNVMCYPSGLLANNKNFNQDRGSSYYDQIPVSLAMCFNENKYSFLFGPNKPYSSVEDWICAEKLNNLFNGEVKIENIKNIGKLTKEKKVKWESLSLAELKEIVKEYKKLLLQRKKALNESTNKVNNFAKAAAKIVIETLDKKKQPIHNPVYYFSKYPKIYNLINAILNQTHNKHKVKYTSIKKLNELTNYKALDLLIIDKLDEIKDHPELENILIEIINNLKKEEKQLIVIGTKELKDLNLNPKLHSLLASGLTIKIE